MRARPARREHVMWLSLYRSAAILAILSNASAKVCEGDGLIPDYESECRQYFRCEGGAVRATYRCGPGRAFCVVARACVPRDRAACVRHTCGARDQAAYPAPGSACARYYRCDNGTARERACPPTAWFDVALQACTYGAGACYEPVCAGLVDGDHPDPTVSCRRRLRCGGGRLQAVSSCSGGVCAGACPAARLAAVRVPVGDASLCGDARCTALCRLAPDGTHASRAAACREYYTCAGGRVLRRGACDEGLAWDGHSCQPAAAVPCAAPARSPCLGLEDGAHRDWRDCSSWLLCQRERVVFRGTCDSPLVFDGKACVPPSVFYCEIPRRSNDCEGRPAGEYQDLKSNCTRYFHCEGGYRTTVSCAAGQAFDGVECAAVESFLCPSAEADSCYGRADGRYSVAGSCRGYFTCAAGQKSQFACAAGLSFSAAAGSCQSAPCERDAGRCRALADGYHADQLTNCTRYFYCDGGDLLASFTCRRGVFDGKSCVEVRERRCGAALSHAALRDGCVADGFYPRIGTHCKGYYVCTNGQKAELWCDADKVFNGQVCVSSKQYECQEK